MEKFSFVFPGQGTQFLQMGKSFYDNYEIAKQTFEEASDVSSIDIANICFNGSIGELNDFTIMQLAILTTEVAIFRAYMSDYGLAPQFAVGHSIGEYAALVSAGAIKFSDAIKIMIKRGELVSKIIEKNNGHMTIVEKTNLEMINECIEQANANDSVYISCYNSNNQYAISGLNQKLELVEQLLIDREAIVSPLFNSPPIHSPLMNEVCMEFLEYINKFEFYQFKFPIIPNYTGAPLSDPKKIAENLTHHLINPVLFTSAIDLFYKYGVTTAIEISPKLLLSDFIKENQPNIKTYCYGLINERKALDEMIKSDSNFEKDVPNFIGKCLSILVTTENKNSNQNEFKEVIKIYEKIKVKYNTFSKNKVIPQIEEKAEILDLLITALKIKKVEKNQLKNCIKSLLDETNTFYNFKNIINSI
ncbi:hypothetical protein B4102_3271 [Heyndrickxia sporothermodurans]|uniref:[acyl-carrier-protein] S-malonyltransferase n=1 Tax=Heyndrickxia sporothermodurans TaxID=46224 RepID=A0A150KWG9_9BACI|nr:ACP S-malonyltransferase [Heyndrickxia sporothermodurans]KYD04425.1 hypothetical protein B4102_3271 [Heyndrickxia sporothermodurans]